MKLPVICDLCNVDWTDRKESGGLVVRGYGVCPDCEVAMRKQINKYSEQHTIDSECPKNMSYAAYIYEVREG